MADTVRYLMESMVPELEALEERGYFSRAEIRQIIQKRQDFEYALKRKAAIKADFLRYIEYESRLEELRQLRRQQQGASGKKTLADYCLTRRIHFIYERMLRKFRGDLSLWARWLAFCRGSGSAKQTSKVLTSALRLHPNAASLWAYAAAWEFEANLNAAAARALMQRGLRMCRHVPALWHEYFRMELLYAMRLRERRRVLGIAPREEGTAVLGEDEETDESEAAVAAVLNGAVAQVVYRNAVAAVPGSLPFRAKFLSILAPFQFPGRAALEDMVYKSIEQDFPGDEEAWDLRARRHTAGSEGPAPLPVLQAAATVYAQAVEALPTPGMRQLLLGFLQEQLEQRAEVAAAAGQPAAAASAAYASAEAAAVQMWLVQASERAYAAAFEAGQVTEETALGGVRMQLHLGDRSAALQRARQATALLPRSAEVWLMALRLEAASLALRQLSRSDDSSGQPQGSHDASSSDDSSSSDDEEQHANGAAARSAGQAQRTQQLHSLEAAALRAVRSVPAADGPSLWTEAISLVAASGGSLARLSTELTKAVAALPKGPLRGGMGAAAAAMLCALAGQGSVAAARTFYQALLRLPPAGGELFHAVLDLELLWAKDPGLALSKQRLHALFEAAVDAYGSMDTQLWLRYVQHEQQAGRGSGQVYWRAVKALEQPDPFIQRFQQLKLQR